MSNPTRQDGTSGALEDPPVECESSAAELIERIGFGCGQLKVLFSGGGCWLADGAELLLLSSVTRAVADEWDLDRWERGLITSIVFVGVLAGNLISGYMGDHLGRRAPLLLSYVGICAFSLLSVLATGFYSITFFRFWVGASFGIGQPAFNALVGETTPAAFRVTMSAMAQMLFSAGELYSAVLIMLQDPQMQDLNWRKLVCWGAMPSFIFLLLALLFLTESPAWLQVSERQEEARRALEDLARANGAQHHVLTQWVPRRASVSTTSTMDRINVVFGRHLLYSTVVVCVSVFTLNFLFYGGLYAFPQVLPKMELHINPSTNLIVGALSEVPGYFIGIFLGGILSRKTCMLIYLLMMVASTLMFGIAGSMILSTELGHWLEVTLQAGLIGQKIFTAFGFLIVYVYSIEIYPTVARATGGALCIAAGRFGSIVAPTIFENLHYLTGSHSSFFSFTAGLCGVNAMLVLFLPYETKGEILKDHLDEIDVETKHLNEPSFSYGH